MTATLLALLLAQGAAAQPPYSLDSFAWLAGCWVGGSGSRQVEEQWMAPKGGAMLGMGRTIADGALREYEFLMLRVEGSDILYVAKPSGQPEASFKLAQIKDGAAVFENPAHDFPQRIIYRRESADRLVARIEGVRNGQSRGIDFPFKRVSCP
jgi:hypothetical protein